MFKRITLVKIVALSAALASAQFAMADQMQAGKVFGDTYAAVAPVAARQVQVVYFRPMSPETRKGAAHVYVDREFHAALLPGGYSAFCVAPGQHSLGAYVNDAPLYKGKSTDTYSADLEAGKTYFLEVREDGSGAPQAVSREMAERELKGMRRQVQALSRASTVQACDYLSMAPTAAAPQYKDYALAGDVLFAFGKSGERDISARGREAVRQLVMQLKRENANLEHIEVVGHTDAIGAEEANQRLGLKRAQTVRRLLLDGGLRTSKVTASSAGSDQPVSQGCSGSRAEQIACYAADRRVVVRVETQR